MQEMLKEADEKLIESSRVAADFKTQKERILSEKNAILNDHTKVVKQLKSLYKTYNDLKSNLEKMKNRNIDLENEKSKIQILFTECEKERNMLKNELKKEIDQRKDTIDKYNVFFEYCEKI